MSIESRIFGTSEGTDVREFILDNSNGIRVHILDYGCIINQLHLPGKNGSADVVLGFDDLEGYLTNTAYIGSIVGRYANRIARGRFIIDNCAYQLDQNEGRNHLHGGFAGFDRQHYQAEAYREGDALCVRLHRVSPHLEAGYPGNLDISVYYKLDRNSLSFEVEATTDMPTPVNIVQHSYFNLAGHNSGKITNHILQINSRHRTEVDPKLVPTGKIVPVANTPYDFSAPCRIADNLEKLLATGSADGFDCNYVLNNDREPLSTAAILGDPDSGRRLEISTNQPGLQFYDSSSLIPQAGKGRYSYHPGSGLCLETQNFPDAVNHSNFPGAILTPGMNYRAVTNYRFDLA